MKEHPFARVQLLGWTLRVHVADDAESAARSDRIPDQWGETDGCPPTAAQDSVLLPARGLKSSHFFRTGRSPPSIRACSSPPSDSPHAILITGPGVRSFSGHLRQAPPASGLHVVTDTATSRGKEKLVSKKAHSEKEPANHQDQQVPFVIMQLCPIPQAVIALLQLGEPISVLEIGNDVSIPQAVIALLQPRCMFVKYTSSGCFNTASGNSPVAT